MAPTMDYSVARHNMVEGQIRPNKVTDFRLVAALSEMPRELFVPKALRSLAYVDEDLGLGNGRYLMEPMVLARLLQAATIQETDLVLDVGAGTGYSSAIAGRLAASVVALEGDAELAAAAGRALQEAGADNVVVMVGPLVDGWVRQAPYDAIVLQGAVAAVPDTLLGQLADGGRLVGVIAGDRSVGQAWLWRKLDGVVSGRVLFDCAVRPLPGFEPKPTFVF